MTSPTRTLAVSLAAATLLLAPLPAAAAPAASDDVIDHEDWHVLGWNDECGVAFTVRAYPKLGAEIADDPYATRAGDFVIPVGKEKAGARWLVNVGGPMSWNAAALAKAEARLKSDGFTRPGYPETIRDAGPVGKPGPALALLSTATLAARPDLDWPPPPWRWAAANYNPLGTCALLAFDRRAAPRRYRFLLARIYNPRARVDRAIAHADNARLLFESGNAEESSAEADAAALQAPELASVRYARASLLAMAARAPEAVAELAAALKLDDALRDKARADEDFADLRDRDDYKDLMAR